MSKTPHSRSKKLTPKYLPAKYKAFKKYSSQGKTIFHYLENHTATASIIAEATGIPQKNITRYKRDLENIGLLHEVEKRFCELTGHRAFYLTTNPKLFPLKSLKK